MTDRSMARTATRIGVTLIGLWTCSAFAKEKPALQPVQMPYVFRDDRGSTWDVQPDASIGDGGNDLFDGGGRLFIGDTQFSSGAAPQMDPDTNELVFSPVQAAGLTVSRRLGCNSKLSYIRYTEILENASANPVKATLRVNFNMGGSVQIAQPLVDEKKKTLVGEVIGDQGNCVALIGAGRGSKLVPRYAPQQGSDNVDVFWEVEVPAKQMVVITHLVCRRANASDAGKVLDELTDKDIVKEMSPELAKRLANFPRSEKFLSDDDLLRGELFDVIELRSGDQYKGTIKQAKYKLNTFFGAVELPAERVIAELSSGEFRPRQLLVTTEGEIFGGKLEGDSIKLELTNGQATNVPLSQITRMGYRKRADEPEELKFEKPFLTLRGGDRMIVQPPTAAISVATRYGTLSIKPSAVAAIVFVSDEQAVHEIQLTDGSKFVGIVAGDAMEMKLATTGQSVAFPISAMRRLQLSTHIDDVDSDSPTLNLTNTDQFVGTIAGVLKVQTAFDTLTVNGPEIRSLQRGKGAPGEVQITLWDNASLSGQLENDSLDVSLASGVPMKVPVALMDIYSNPQARPPAQVVDRIKVLVGQLNAEDWKARDRAEAQLAAIGPALSGVLGELRTGQPAEVQQRIDVILKAVRNEKAPASPAVAQPLPEQLMEQ